MTHPSDIAVVGGGPGGLMAAERLAGAGHRVSVFEHMPSVGRKFLLAGRGGLNITHSEPMDSMLARYGDAEGRLRPYLEAFDAAALADWCAGLGEQPFVGSSGRMFPKSFRATALLRAWTQRLDDLGVHVHTGHRWTGWSGAPPSDTARQQLEFVTTTSPEPLVVSVDATLLALGGASWPRVGSDGAWTSVLADAGVRIEPLRPSNSGFVVDWTETFLERHAGAPIKNIAVEIGGQVARGELMISDTGVEGGAIYAISAALRDAVETDGVAVLRIDLQPDLDGAALRARLARRRPKDSLSTVLGRVVGLDPVEVSLMREATGNRLPHDDSGLAALIKSLPLRLTAVESIDRAISTAGGISFAEVDEALMLKRVPGTFVAGEMLDWEAPTGGYLLQATFSTAVAAADGLLDFLARQRRTDR